VSRRPAWPLSTAGSDFKTNYLLQDAAVLNIIRACETALDLANMLIRRRRLGIPSESRESFGILVREQLLERSLGSRRWWASVTSRFIGIRI
jgi:uncharacterized protein YutE (UPF0331/DUF86 family)